MKNSTITLNQILSNMHQRSCSRLLDFVRCAERERLGKRPLATLRLPVQPRVVSTLRRKFRAMDTGMKSELLDYACYLKKCQNVRVERSAIRARHKVSWWSPTPRWVVIEALKLAELGPGDVLFDLGCGDGRVVVDSVRLFGASVA